MSATLPREDVEQEQVFDYELEEHAGDGEECVRGDGPATHVYRHPGCMAYICTNHAKIAVAQKARFPRFLRCSVCGATPLLSDALTVVPK